MLHTHIHRPVKAGYHVIMSELGNNFAWSTFHAILLSTPHRLSFASFLFRIIVLSRFFLIPSRLPDFQVEFPFRPFIFFYFIFIFTTIKDACLYVNASYLFNISNDLSISHLLPLRQFLVHVTVISLLRMTCISCHDDNS